MSKPSGLAAPIGPNAVHLCVDMQRLFAEATDWHTPWMERILPEVARLTQHRPARTIFTRFIPARSPDAADGTWRRYYRQWRSMTLECLPPDAIEILPELARFVPPARVWDKQVYSPWLDGNLHGALRERSVETLIVSGGETDVCVLATVLGAVDLGYRVVVATDALCSSSDETHDWLLGLYQRRYGQQVETADVQEIISAW